MEAEPEADGHLDDVVVTVSVFNGVNEDVCVREIDDEVVTELVFFAVKVARTDGEIDVDPDIEGKLDDDVDSENCALNDWVRLLVTVEEGDFNPVRDAVLEMEGDEVTDGLVVDEAQPDDDAVTVGV